MKKILLACMAAGVVGLGVVGCASNPSSETPNANSSVGSISLTDSDSNSDSNPKTYDFTCPKLVISSDLSRNMNLDIPGRGAVTMVSSLDEATIKEAIESVRDNKPITANSISMIGPGKQENTQKYATILYCHYLVGNSNLNWALFPSSSRVFALSQFVHQKEGSTHPEAYYNNIDGSSTNITEIAHPKSK